LRRQKLPRQGRKGPRRQVNRLVWRFLLKNQVVEKLSSLPLPLPLPLLGNQ
jgi:hypothetical protein